MVTTQLRTPASSDSSPGSGRVVFERPRWATPALIVLLLGAAVLYIWNLSASGYANSFYSAAAQAGSKSWEAFFYGSSDAANSITVDKPPAALWITSLSVRAFGLSSWSILVPEALIGVASVALLYRIVKTRFGYGAGLLAALVLALTPVATLMFRFNNPDALLVLIMIAAVGTLLKAVEDGRTRWLVWTGVLVGLGFLTKQLQVFLILPALSITYLVAGPVALRKRFLQLLAAGLAMVVAGGWWIAVVELVPANMRPFIGGSQNNSILELTFGYNGFGRLTGAETGSVVPGGNATASTGKWGETGITRLFGSEMGGQIAWLLPAALVLLAVGLVLRGRRTRTDAKRASFMVWGLWLVITGLTFSFMSGIIHPYYTVALAPALAAVVGAGAAELWKRRQELWASIALAVLSAGTAFWAYELLGRTATFVPWLRTVILVVGIVAAIGLLLVKVLPRRVIAAVAMAAGIAALAGPTAYAVQTVSTGHTGAIVSAGPNTGRGFGGGGGGRPGGQFPNAAGQARAGQNGGAPGATPQTGAAPTAAAGGQRGFGGGGGLFGGSKPSAEMITLLETNADQFTWVAATTTSDSAAGYQLATQDPVMAIGGFNGTDPSPTLAEFQADVAGGKIHYYIAAATGGFGGASTDAPVTPATEISTWVKAHYAEKTVGTTTVYDLTAPTS